MKSITLSDTPFTWWSTLFLKHQKYDQKACASSQAFNYAKAARFCYQGDMSTVLED